jgi:hypothetical protein
MSRLLSAADYQRELAELDAIIASEEQISAEYGTEPASELLLDSLRSRREALATEMLTLGDEGMPQQELDVIVEGRPVHQHAVEVPFLSKLLEDLQNLVRSIAASASGSASRTGPLTESVRQRAGLRFAASFPGSFGMRIETGEQELDLDDAGSQLHTFGALLDLLNGEQGEDLLGSLTPLNPRARSHYVTLLEHLSASGADVRIRWGTTKGPRTVALRARQARRIADRLTRIAIQESIHSYEGLLDGAMRTRGLFEFHANDGRVFAGEIAPNIPQDLREFFLGPCVALITTRQLRDTTTGDVRIHHRLEQLGRVEDGLFPEPGEGGA